MILEPRGSYTHPGDRLMSNDSVNFKSVICLLNFPALVVINFCYCNKIGI